MNEDKLVKRVAGGILGLWIVGVLLSLATSAVVTA